MRPIRVPRRLRKLAIGVILAMTAMAALADNAAANTQTTTPLDFTGNGTLTGICSFPLAFTGHIVGTSISVRDDTGALIKMEWHVTEQDVISANGRILTGDPYPVAAHFSYTNGVLTEEVATGIAERIPLPDGSVFLSAGLINVLLSPNGISITPNHGLTGDIAVLCAVLSP